MIVAGYAGAGKSYLAQRWEQAVEVPSMPYSWVLPPREDGFQGEYEGEKGAPYHLPNPLYPENYLLAILQAEQARGVVIIPTIPMILYRLCREWERRVLLFYPEDGLREEYRQRYLGRGNRAEFLELFLGRWENYLDSFRELEERGCGIHIRLKSGEYLSHYREQLQRATAEAPCPVPAEDLRELEEELRRGKEQIVLTLEGEEQTCCYLAGHWEAPGVQSFLYQAGRLAYDAGGRVRARLWSGERWQFYRELAGEPVRCLHTPGEVLAVLTGQEPAGCMGEKGTDFHPEKKGEPAP